jgi:hypothetical protein
MEPSIWSLEVTIYGQDVVITSTLVSSLDVWAALGSR